MSGGKNGGKSRAAPTRAPAQIRNLPTDVPGLDNVFGGGLPEYSFSVIAGGPGSGKTTLALQIAFAAATAERPALYFTVLGEPTLKMLRYQSQFSFFDAARVGGDVQFINLTDEVVKQDLDAVLQRIVGEVERTEPGVVIVDSFRTLGTPNLNGSAAAIMDLERFVQRLAQNLTTWETTSFLLGEYGPDEDPYPLFTVADTIIRLSQVTDRNSVVRKMQVQKARGRAPQPGLHTFRITDNGIEIFPRIPQQGHARKRQQTERQGSGVPGLDEVLGGGLPVGDAVMIVGPAGSGKTTFATQFAFEGLRAGESVVIAVFEEYPEEYLARARARGHDIEEAIAEDKLRVIYLRPLDLSPDETLYEILQAIDEVDAARMVIDSLSGFEIALAPSFREDFKESLYRLVGAVTATGVTVLMTSEIVGGFPDMGITTEKVSFVTDDIIIQRFVEIDGELRQVLSVVKMRGGAHSHDFRTYEITSKGAVVGGPLKDYQRIITGVPELRRRLPRIGYKGLTDREAVLLDTLVRLGVCSEETIAARVMWPPEELTESLERLIALGYASYEKDGAAGHAFRAVVQADG